MSSKKCSEGSIMRVGYTKKPYSRKAYTRKAYTRKSYTRKDGTVVKAARVPESKIPATKVGSVKVSPTCIKDLGKPGKGKKIIPMDKHFLAPYGYHFSKSDRARHLAIGKAVTVHKPLPIFRYFNAIYVLQKNINPEVAKKAMQDRDYVKSKYSKMKYFSEDYKPVSRM